MDAQTWVNVREWLSLLGASGAGWANLYAVWVWRGSPWVQTFYGATAMLAYTYAWGYIYLIVTGDVLGWSHFFQNVGPMVWVLVWTIPAIASARAHKSTVEAIGRTSELVARSLKNRSDDGMDLP